MKLTNSIKHSIVNAVMADVPEEYSYSNFEKDARVLAVDMLPSEVRKIYENVQLRVFIATKCYSAHGTTIYLPIGDAKTQTEKLNAVFARYAECKSARCQLRVHVNNVVSQFSTDKQMIALIPELERYLPKPVVATKNLPVVNSLMADLVNFGWKPK